MWPRFLPAEPWGQARKPRVWAARQRRTDSPAGLQGLLGRWVEGEGSPPGATADLTPGLNPEVKVVTRTRSSAPSPGPAPPAGHEGPAVSGRRAGLPLPWPAPAPRQSPGVRRRGGCFRSGQRAAGSVPGLAPHWATGSAASTADAHFLPAQAADGCDPGGGGLIPSGASLLGLRRPPPPWVPAGSSPRLPVA